MSEYVCPIQMGGYPIPGSANNTAIGPLLEIQTGPTDYAIITEISIVIYVTGQATIPYPIGFGTPATKGVGVNTGGAQAVDPRGDAPPGVHVYSLWQTWPSAPTFYLRRLIFVGPSTTNGAFWVRFYFPSGIKMAPTSSRVVWAPVAPGNAAGSFDYHVVFDA